MSTISIIIIPLLVFKVSL